MFLCQLKTKLLFILLFPSITQSGSNALHCAALNGHAGVIRVLVPMKCNPNQQRKDGWTPLHLGCWNGHQDVVHELIICKSQVNSRTNVSEIFSAAFAFGVHLELLIQQNASIGTCMITRLSIHMQEGMGALHLAAAKGCDEIVQELLDAGVAPDMQDKVANLICITYIVGVYTT